MTAKEHQYGRITTCLFCHHGFVPDTISVILRQPLHCVQHWTSTQNCSVTFYEYRASHIALYVSCISPRTTQPRLGLVLAARLGSTEALDNVPSYGLKADIRQIRGTGTRVGRNDTPLSLLVCGESRHKSHRRELTL